MKLKEWRKSDTSVSLTCTLTWHWSDSKHHLVLRWKTNTLADGAPALRIDERHWIGRRRNVKLETLHRIRGVWAVTVVAVLVWFSIFTLSLNKRGLALGPSGGQRGAGCKGKKEERESKGKREKSSQFYVSYSENSTKGRQSDLEIRRKRQQRKWEGGCTSTENLIMHGRAAGAKERKRDGWRGKEESTHLRRGMRRAGEKGRE